MRRISLLGSAAFTATLIVSILSFAAIFSGSASAGERRGYDDGTVVTADSRFGNGSVSGPVRRGQYAWEVRLPRGTWVSCRRSCEETLRVETVDYFETKDNLTGYGSIQAECGVFGCLEITHPY